MTNHEYAFKLRDSINSFMDKLKTKSKSELNEIEKKLKS
jgi:hypothetical protein